MDKKYQVFVSSTYRDLSDERQEVMQALLELDCIPVGMELFPAADDDQWSLIKRLIDDCDYYILIIGGRYGSLNSEGVSYTQMEYEYAMSKEIPIISFLHKNPEEISVGKSETSSELKGKLLEFRNLAQKKMCKYWSNSLELGSIVSRSLVKLIKDKPRDGWVKASQLPNEEITKQLFELKQENENLKNRINSYQFEAPKGSEDLSSGADMIEVRFSYKHGEKFFYKSATSSVNLTWDEIFYIVSPLMIDEASENSLVIQINTLIKNKSISKIRSELTNDLAIPIETKEFMIFSEDFQTIKIQFRALGLITESLKKRQISDKNKYWTLTSYGDSVMTRLRAIKKIKL